MALVAVALVVSAIYLGVNKYGKKASEVHEVSEQTRQSLMDASCDDSALNNTRQALEAKRGTSDEGVALQDLASCYEFRNDYDNVRSTYESLADWQEANGQMDAAIETRGSIEELDFRREFEQNPPVIDDDDEIWS